MFSTIAVLFAVVVIQALLARKFGKLPPGPRGVPILGNILQVGGTSWLVFDKWKYEYGPIVYLNLAGQHIVVLNSKATATELLDRRSSIYSDRPRNVVAEYLGSLITLPFAKYGRTWQSMRRASHAVLNSRASTRYQPVQIDEAVILADGLLNDQSSSLLTKINRSASTIISMVYGKPPLASEQVTVLEALSQIAHRYTEALYPGAYLVEIIPVLDYLPPWLAKWKRDAQTDQRKFSTIFEGYFSEAVKNEDQKSSLCVSLAENQSASGLTDVENAWLAGAISVSALETTSTTLSWFLYAMIQHPNAQKAAHEEIDRVVGRSRNPTFADMQHLPYIRAIVKEILRWQPAIPLAVPHILMEDDWYEGYFIPKGTTCIPNVWSINRDIETYGPDANEFRPERFLDEKGRLRPEFEAEDGHCAYGFGRRICVGRYVADNALFIDMCTILWALTIEPADSSQQDDVRLATRPAPLKDLLNPIPDFHCKFCSRFPDADGILRSLRDDIIQGQRTSASAS